MIVGLENSGVSFLISTDFTRVEETLTFTPGVSQLCDVYIEVFNDTVLESEESFMVLLSHTEADAEVVELSIDAAIITIIEDSNDGEYSYFLSIIIEW